MKYTPEGWNEIEENYNLDEIKSIYETGKIIQGKVIDCDSNFNLYVKLRRKSKWSNT